MSLLSRSFAAQAQQAAVEIWSNGHFLGSGFFLEQPHLVVTCAHVVWGHPDLLKVHWREHRLDGEVRVRLPPDKGLTDFYADPDLAFIRVTGAPDPPVAKLTTSPAMPRQLVALGFSPTAPQSGVGRHSLKLEVVGPSGAFIRVKGDEIPQGMSGSLALDPETGLVCAVVKGSADYESVRGGWVVGATHLAVAREQYASLLGAPAAAKVTLSIEPGDQLHDLLTAQQKAAERMPYKLVDGPSPPLSSVYVRQRAAPRRDQSANWTRSFNEVLTAHRHVLVVGGPGSGKSALVQRMVGETASWWLDGLSEEQPPYGPVLTLRLPATSLRKRKPWLNLIAEAVQEDLAEFLMNDLDPAAFDPRLYPGVDWLLLIDGLDEVVDNVQREQLVAMLSKRIAEHGQSWKFIVTSRPLFEREFDGLGASLTRFDPGSRFGEYELCQFDSAALGRFAEAWFTVRTPTKVRPNTTGYIGEIEHRGLDHLVRVPLLATISAVVYETHPNRPLPISQAGLYQQFVNRLLYAPERRRQLHETLRAQFAPYGSGADELVDLLYSKTEECLEHVSQRWLGGTELTLSQLAWEWWRERSDVPTLLTGVRPEELLISSGLIAVAGNDLRFIHRGFAEYLAAGHSLRNGFDARAWLRAARKAEISNVDMLRLARWAERGHDASTVVEQLLQPGINWWQRVTYVRSATSGEEPAEGLTDEELAEFFAKVHKRQFRFIRWEALWHRPFLTQPGLLKFCAILLDGVPFPPEKVQRILDRGFAAVRRMEVVHGGAVPTLTYVLGALRSRDSSDDRLVRLALNPRVDPVKRIAAARALSRLESSASRVQARLAMRAILDDRWMATADRCWAGAALFEIGTGDDIDHMVRQLTRLITTSVSEDAQEAAATLAALGLIRSAVMPMLTRAASPLISPTDRNSALLGLYIGLDQTETARSAGKAFAYGPGLASRPPRAVLVGRRILDHLRHRYAAWAAPEREGLYWHIGGTLADVAPDEVDAALALLRAAMTADFRDVAARGSIISGIASSVGDEAAVDELRHLASVGTDPFDLISLSHWLSQHSPAAASALQREWLEDEAVDPRLRLHVLDHLRAKGERFEGFIYRWQADDSIPLSVRLSALLSLSIDRDHLPEILGILRTHMRRPTHTRWQRAIAFAYWVTLHAIAYVWLRRLTAEQAPIWTMEQDDQQKQAERVTLSAARELLTRRAEEFRLVNPAGLDDGSWRERSLEASIGPQAAHTAEQTLTALMENPRAAVRLRRRLGRRFRASRCKWWTELLRRADRENGAERAVLLALALAMHDAAVGYQRAEMRHTRAQRYSEQSKHIGQLVARPIRDVAGVAIGLAACYLVSLLTATMAGLLWNVPAAVDLGRTQSILALPVITIMCLLLYRPARKASRQLAALAVILTGALAALPVIAAVAGFRLPELKPWEPAVQPLNTANDYLLGLNWLVARLLPAQNAADAGMQNLLSWWLQMSLILLAIVWLWHLISGHRVWPGRPTLLYAKWLIAIALVMRLIDLDVMRLLLWIDVVGRAYLLPLILL